MPTDMGEMAENGQSPTIGKVCMAVATGEIFTLKARSYAEILASGAKFRAIGKVCMAVAICLHDQLQNGI